MRTKEVMHKRGGELSRDETSLTKRKMEVRLQ